MKQTQVVNHVWLNGFKTVRHLNIFFSKTQYYSHDNEELDLRRFNWYINNFRTPMQLLLW